MMERSGRLAGRIAVITGAAGGIGSGIAKAYAAEGAVLALVDRDTKKLAQVVDAIAADGGGVQAFTTELRDPASIASTFSQIREQVGSPEILVNNAGIDTTSNVVDMPIALWDEMIEINLRSVFLCTQQVLRDMIARKWGRIINTASQLGHKGAPQMAHYAAAKAGVIAFTRSLAYEVAAHGITVNAVCPGPIETPLLFDLPADWLERKRAELPIGRFGRINEVVPTYVLLASEGGSYFVGSTLNMNGGDVMI